jgi:menaquinone-dependent protoporphyrinogen IX oxidase
MRGTSCEHESRLMAKNIAALHSALMNQPDATRTAVDEAIRKMLTEIERQTWERIAWLGGHYCPEWDQMFIDRTMSAWDACICDVKSSLKN